MARARLENTTFSVQELPHFVAEAVKIRQFLRGQGRKF
jgi:hypothetical protein